MALLYLFEDAYDRSEFCILPLFSNCCRVLIFNISHVPQGPRPQQHLEGCRNVVLESTKLKPCDWFIVDV